MRLHGWAVARRAGAFGKASVAGPVERAAAEEEEEGELEEGDGMAGFLESLEGAGGLVAEIGDLRGDGKLIKSVIRHGFMSGIRPQLGDEVTVHFIGTLEDGHVFDDTRRRGEPFKFRLGLGHVIKGWDEGVATMWKGERSLLTVHSDLAYGAQGAGWKIPANATVKFDVELLDVDEIDPTGPEWAYEVDENETEPLPVGREDIGEGGEHPQGRYWWERRGIEVVVTMPLPDGVGPRDIEHSFAPRRVRIVVAGEAVLEGVPGCELAYEECFWEIGYSREGERCLFVHLHKQDEEKARWPDSLLSEAAEGGLRPGLEWATAKLAD